MSALDQFIKARNIVLETYRKSGAPVRTPVWLVVDGGTIYVRTDPKSGKAKRIRNNPHVRLAPSDMRGNVKGEWADGDVRPLAGADAERILALFGKKYGFAVSLMRLWHRIRGFPPYLVLAISIRPSGNPP